MERAVLRLSSCEPGFAVAHTPIWVLDTDESQIHWANDAALELWNATDRDELYARDMAANAPPKLTTRLRDTIARTFAGEVVREEWAFYPRGEAMLLPLELRAIVLDDGRLALLNQVLPITSDTSPSTRRAMVVARNLSVICALLGPDGAILSQNPAALECFGTSDAWLPHFVEPDAAAQIIASALAGQPAATTARVRTEAGLRWHAVTAEKLRDPVTGTFGVLVEHRDITARIEAEHVAETRQRRIDDLDAALDVVARQRNEILALSAPILDVGAGTLAVPIIGRFDADQSQALSARLLDAVSARRVDRVILDVTGVEAIDAGNTERLRRLVGALRLLGAMPVLTGVRPEVARSLIVAGGILGVPTVRSLAVALQGQVRKRL